MKALFLLFLSAISFNCYSCVCSEIDLKEIFARSEYVFIGMAIGNIHQDTIVGEILDQDRGGSDVEFKIERVFKGDIPLDTIAIMQGGDNCTLTFRFGKRYLVFGSKKDALDTEDIERKKLEDMVWKEFSFLLTTSSCLSFSQESKLYRKFLRRRLSRT